MDANIEAGYPGRVKRTLPALTLLLPTTAAAQSISSSGALGENFLLVVLAFPAVVLGLPSVLVYAIASRVFVGRWARWSLPIPLLASMPLGLWGFMMMLDSAMFFGVVLPILAELGLITVLVVVGRWWETRSGKQES